MDAKRLSAVGLVVALSAVGLNAANNDGGRLIDAIKAGNREAVRALLKQTKDVNVQEPDGTTPLHWAARADNAAIAEMLLRAGADAKASNRYGSTPIELAAVNGNAAMLEMLLKAGADVNTKMAEGETILMTAARTGRPEALMVLVAHGANVNASEGWLGENALMWAAQENHPEALKILISAGADVNAASSPLKFPRKVRGQTTLPTGGMTPLMFAARQGAMDAVKVLAENGADLNKTDPDGDNALIFAIINAHYDAADLLLQKGADPNVADANGMAALYATVDMNTQQFMHGRPDPKPTGPYTAVDMVRILLDHGANPNQVLKSPILRKHNNAPNQFLSTGSTPLMRAAKTGDVTVMKMLIAKGADPKLRQKNQTTLLMLAAGFGRRFDQNADAQEFDRATEEDLLAGVKFLVNELHVDVNETNDVGDTALHWSGGEGIKFLVANGANLNAKNKQGKTPLDVAMARQDKSKRQLRPAAVVALKELGAVTTGAIVSDILEDPQ